MRGPLARRLCIFDLLRNFDAGQAFAFAFGVVLCTAAVGVLALSRQEAASTVDQNALIDSGGWDCAPPRPAAQRVTPSRRSPPRVVSQSSGTEWRLEPLSAPSLAAPPVAVVPFDAELDAQLDAPQEPRGGGATPPPEEAA